MTLPTHPSAPAPSDRDPTASVYLHAVEASLGEWHSAADESAYRTLGDAGAILDTPNTATQHSTLQAQTAANPTPRQPGSAKGQIEMAADFHAPLDDFTPYS